MKKINTVKTKQLIVFLSMISFILTFAGVIFYVARRFMTEALYEQMKTQAVYQVNLMENQLEQSLRQQANFFIDRQLVLLVDDRLLDDYESREAKLSIQEKLVAFEATNQIVRDAVLYIPKGNIVITKNFFGEFDDEAEKQVKELQGELGDFVLKGNTLQYTLTEFPYADSMESFFYLKVSLNNAFLEEQLNDFVISQGGSFWYHPDLKWFLEDTEGEGIGKEVLEEVNDIEGIGKVRVNGTAYLVNVMESAYFGKLVQYCSANSVMQKLDWFTGVFAVFVFSAIILAFVFSGYTERLVNRPLKTLYKAFHGLQEGNLQIQLNHSYNDEFSYIYNGFNQMVINLKKMIKEVYEQKSLASQAELKQLQAQISPHFLYNSFFIFSGRVGRGDYQGAKVFADYLGTYFRYLARNDADIVKLEDEIEHAESYARIQESRFISRVELIWEPLPEEAKGIQVPRLIVQPILENFYKYGLEKTEEGGVLRVFYRREKGTFLICVENNAPVGEEELAYMQGLLSDTYTGEITGMVNVHRRLKNYFKQKAGLHVKRGELGGVLITLQISLEMEEE